MKNESIKKEILSYIEKNQYGTQESLIEKFGEDNMFKLYQTRIISLHQNKDKTNTYKITNSHLESFNLFKPESNPSIQDIIMNYSDNLIMTRNGVFKLLTLQISVIVLGVSIITFIKNW